MLLAADENLNDDIIRGLLRRNPNINIIRVQDVGLSGEVDPVILEWCASEGRVLLTHDVTTITKHAYNRIAAGQPMPGIFEVPRQMSVGAVIEDILLLAECSLDGEWDCQIRYLPLR